MSPELVLIASIVLGVILVPSLITVRPPSYLPMEDDQPSSILSGQPTE